MSSEREATADGGAATVASRSGDDLEILRLALRGLPPRQREALSLAVVHKLDVPAISGRLGIDATTVRTDLRDGLLSLRAVLDVVERSAAMNTPHVPDA